MFKVSTGFVSMALIPVLVSCASGVKRGVVAMKIDSTDAHVAMNKDEVSVGEHVELYWIKWVRAQIKGSIQTCEKVKKGHGVVTEILNDHYSAVKFADGVEFKEGDFIEIHSHK